MVLPGERKRWGELCRHCLGDIHDIGKNFVGVLLTAALMSLIWALTPPERFIAAIKQYQPAIVGLSGC
jgi:methanogenic corrinoid protein MtbC1